VENFCRPGQNTDDNITRRMRIARWIYEATNTHSDFNCCLSVHVDNYTIIIPTKCSRFLIGKSTRCYNLYFFCLVFLPLHFSTRVGHLQGVQCQCLAKVIIDYDLLKLL
jgi:hypothetical protein